MLPGKKTIPPVLRRASVLAVVLFLLPTVVMYTLYFVYPLFSVVGTSFTDWNGVSPPTFVGWQNYIDNFGDSNFRMALRNNLVWGLSLGVVQITLSLAMALILSHQPRGWRVLRTVYFLPHVISKVAIAMFWAAIYNAEFGALNNLLTRIGLEHWTRNWLGDLHFALPAVILQEMLYIGYFMIILLAGRLSISPSLYEAAYMDGATRWQQDVYITLPHLKTILVSTVIVAMAFGIRHFESTFLLTRGGPANRTTVLGLQLYNKLGALDYGHASAISVTLIILGAVLIGAVRIIARERKR